MCDRKYSVLAEDDWTLTLQCLCSPLQPLSHTIFKLLVCSKLNSMLFCGSLAKMME